jgi:hypothetical protein
MHYVLKKLQLRYNEASPEVASLYKEKQSQENLVFIFVMYLVPVSL